jgi:hypothetical protein
MMFVIYARTHNDALERIWARSSASFRGLSASEPFEEPARYMAASADRAPAIKEPQIEGRGSPEPTQSHPPHVSSLEGIVLARKSHAPRLLTADRAAPTSSPPDGCRSTRSRAASFDCLAQAANLTIPARNRLRRAKRSASLAWLPVHLLSRCIGTRD